MGTMLMILPILASLGCLVQATNYNFEIEEDGLLAPCQDQPGNHVNIFNGLLDVSNMNVTNGRDVVSIAGDATVIWKDVQPEDFISFSGHVYKWERNKWIKQVYSLSTNNFCQDMFQKGQIWYTFWTSHITNTEEIKSKCIKTLGTVVKHEPYDMEMKANVNMPNMAGRYKLVIIMEALDKSFVKRPIYGCTEIRGIAIRG
ncbi:hypothetical protein KR018_005902 [Drosophila ironensis]|nr:hypothetical protein KR018_005902 [Drosophila ironensis]